MTIVLTNFALLIGILFKGKWCQKTFTTIMTEYKAVLHNWYKGTGGGSGDITMFGNWSSEKLDRYDIDPDLYDHTRIEDRPPIMIDVYTKHKNTLLCYLYGITIKIYSWPPNMILFKLDLERLE